jgi:hypothetical protein
MPKADTMKTACSASAMNQVSGGYRASKPAALRIAMASSLAGKGMNTNTHSRMPISVLAMTMYWNRRTSPRAESTAASLGSASSAPGGMYGLLKVARAVRAAGSRRTGSGSSGAVMPRACISPFRISRASLTSSVRQMRRSSASVNPL